MNDAKRHSDDLLELARKVVDGESIDWADAQSTFSGPPDRLRGLRVVESISRVHGEMVDDEAAGAPKTDGLPFATWGPLELIAPVARGGFGEVFRAHDRRLDRAVALKLLRSRVDRESAADDSAYLGEARRLAGVRHPNVVLVFGVDRFRERDGLWMEWIDGETLEESVQVRGPLGPHEAAHVGIEACRALAAVHAAGLVHRDVKLANLARERGGRIVLMDFGSSTRVRGGARGEPGRLSGTPSYLAPEAFEGQDSGVGMDVYALGVALYRLSSGAYPLRRGTIEDMRRQHREQSGVPLRDRNPSLPTAFVRIVERAMHTDPAQRFDSVGKMERALDAFVAGAIEPRKPGVRAWWVHPSVRVAAVLVLVALAAFGVFRATHRAGGTDFAAQATFYRWNEQRHTRERLTDGARIAPGDQLFLELASGEPAWVYVINEDAKGHEFLLFPVEGLERANPLPGGTSERLPGSIGGVDQAWDVTSAGGDEALLVVASRHPLDVVEQHIRTLARSGSSRPAELASGGVVSRLRGLGGISPAPQIPAGSPATLAEIRDRVKLLDGGGRDVRVWELRLSNPE
jgi:hypothetical protein